jgi:hypothetical protein
MQKTTFLAAAFSFIAPTFLFADITGEEEALKIINGGIVVSGTIGAGSSYRDDKQAVYVMHEGTLYLCNLFTQKKRSDSEALVAAECFHSSQ